MAHSGGTAWGEHMKEEERSLFQKDDFQGPIEGLRRSTVHLETMQEALQTCGNAQKPYSKAPIG